MKKKIEEWYKREERSRSRVFITILRKTGLDYRCSNPSFLTNRCGIRTKAFRLIYVLVSPSEAKSDKGERHGIDREP